MTEPLTKEEQIAKTLETLTTGKGRSIGRLRNDPKVTKTGQALRSCSSFDEYFASSVKPGTNVTRWNVLLPKEISQHLWKLRNKIPPDVVSASQIVSWLILTVAFLENQNDPTPSTPTDIPLSTQNSNVVSETGNVDL